MGNSKKGFFHSLAWLALAVVAAVMPLHAQEALMPRRTAEGIEFSLRAPGATGAFLLGDFNRWGEPGPNGIPAPVAAMESKAGDGIFRRTQALAPGTYRFRYVVAGRLADPVRLDATRLPIAPDGSHILRIDSKGEVVAEGTPYVYAPRAVDGGVEFRVYAPAAKAAFLAGSFNNWGDAQAGVISDIGYRLFRVTNKEFVKVTDLPAGRHEYAIVLDTGSGANQWIEGATELPLSESKHRTFVVGPKSGTPTPTPAATMPATTVPAGRVPPGNPFCFPPRVLPDGGLEFGVYAPSATSVYLAGDFNGWANHTNGSTAEPTAQLHSVGKGYFRRTFYLLPDTYCFKYCIDGRPSWVRPSTAYLPTDRDDNSVFTLADGKIVELQGKYSPWLAYEISPGPTDPKPPSGVRMLRLFYHPSVVACGPLMKWIYSPAGRALNERVPIYLVDTSKGSPTPRTYQVLRVPTAILVETDGTERDRVVFEGNLELFQQKMEALAQKGIRR